MKIDFDRETDGRWIAEVPSMPGVIAYGRTKEEAQRRAMNLAERVAEAQARTLVAGFFSGDQAKTALWFRTANPLLGHLCPNDLVRMGRAERLLRFVEGQLEENVGPERQP
jgi:hypothetical protein